jgi:uracil-DNA glycosylase
MTRAMEEAGSGMTDGGDTPAGGRGAARSVARAGWLGKMPPQQKRGRARLPGRRVEPAPRLQGQRARFAQHGGQRPRMQRLFHDAQDLAVLAAVDPDDAARIEAEACEPGRVAVAADRRPEQMTLPAAKDARRNCRDETRDGRREFSLQPLRGKLMQRAELQAAVRERRIQAGVRERQNAAVLGLQVMAFQGADLHPQGFELIHDTIRSCFVPVLSHKLIAVNLFLQGFSEPRRGATFQQQDPSRGAAMAANTEQMTLDIADEAFAERTFEITRQLARDCRACHLWEPATQTVFGEGPVPAPVLLIGEQPGDKEDLTGRPFVGPAGLKLNAALEDAGVDRGKVYVTNAVKHFKYVPRGKIRLHQKPVAVEIKACRSWLERELDFVQPKVAVAMGATAAQSLFGKATPINKNRGRLVALGSCQALVTIHPSYLLRIQEEADAAAEYARFVADLKLLRPFLG